MKRKNENENQGRRLYQGIIKMVLKTTETELGQDAQLITYQ